MADADLNFVTYLREFSNVFKTGEDVTEFWALNTEMLGTVVVLLFILFVLFGICFLLWLAFNKIIPQFSK